MGFVVAIKRGVSMYSLQDAYARHRFDLRGVMEFVTDLGAGVELISDQMIKGTPQPSAQTLQEWDDIVADLRPTLVCNDIFINSTLYKNRVLRHDEQLALLVADLELSHRLGFSMVRPVSDTDAEVLEAALPVAESLGLVMAMEVHAGMSYGAPLTQRFIEMCERTGSPHLGLTVDLGIFVDRLPRVWSNYFRSLGTSPRVIDWVEKCYRDNGDTYRAFHAESMARLSIPAELRALFERPIDEEYAFFSTGYESTSFEVFDRYLPITRHIHGKFYEITEDGLEYSIDYPAVISHLNDVRYDGYVSSEYEGQRFVPIDGEPIDDVAQVRRHQDLLSSLIPRAVA